MATKYQRILIRTQQETNCNWKWTGFLGKTLWDWLRLLITPVALTIGGFWFSQIQKNNELKIADDNQREATLQAYIGNMSELLLEKKLRESQPEDEVCKVACVRTLIVLHRLDARRKGSALQFLYEANLIDKDKRIIDLQGADLRRTDLSETELSGADLRHANLCHANLCHASLIDGILRGANLVEANLSKADLSGADLRGTDLRRTNLRGTNFSQADFRGANLRGANLRGANLSEADLGEVVLNQAILSEADLRGTSVTLEQLEKAKSLKGATIGLGPTYLSSTRFKDNCSKFGK